MTREEVRVKDILNAQTGKLAWPELARHFARGSVVCVSHGEDLLAVAEAMVGDNDSVVNRLHEKGKLHRALDDDARRWEDNKSEFWAVVVAPWVLVQEISEE